MLGTPTSDGLEEDYLGIARRRGPNAALATALRTRSLAARELFAYAATGGVMDMSALTALLGRSDVISERMLDVEWSSLLARLLALQHIREHDLALATDLYRAADSKWGLDALKAVDQELFVQLLFSQDRAGSADLLARSTAVRPEVRAYLEADLINPFVGSIQANTEHWLKTVKQRFFPTSEAIQLTGDALHPFDRLYTEPEADVDGPMVTVIVTAYRPDEGLLTSVGSLTRQSWGNLDIVVVDDSSGPEFADILREAESLDSRVRLIRLTANGGTYLARNAGLDAARGEFVTFQDADDWTHPRRLERQVLPLLQDSSIPATRSAAVRASDTLLFQKLGYLPERPIASSLMFRRAEAVERVGYFDRVRKAGDTEYHKRLELVLGGRSVDLTENLSVVRLRSGSLSREEFRAGWHHPARYSYRLAYEHWHKTVRARATAGARVPRGPHARRFPAPRRFMVSASEESRASRLDVVFLSEWRRYGGPQKSMIEEIRALRHAGRTVGIAQIEAMRFMGTGRPPLCNPVQELINSGAVQHVLPDDDVDVDLVIVRYPPVLQFPPAEAFAWRTEHAWVVANQAPSEVDGSDRRYRVRECHRNATRLLGCEPEWVPQSQIIRSLLTSEWPEVPLAAFDNPGILDSEEWDLPRRRPHTDRPIIGRHSRDEALKWPGHPADLLAVYPDSDEVDVRVMGGIGQLRHIMGDSWQPTTWLTYGHDELPVRHFLAQLDFFVYFHDERMHEAFGRSILEALATGCVVILPEHFRQIFGEAALYCSPHEVRSLVESLHQNPRRFVAQSDRGRRVVRERFSHESFRNLVQAAVGASAGHSEAALPKKTVSAGR